MLAALAAMAQAPVERPADSQQPRSEESAGGAEEELVGELKFSTATLEVVLNDYAAKTDRTLLLDPKLPKASITLRSQGKLAMTDYLQAIDTVLSMNGIAVLKVGDRFLKVVPISQAGEEAMKISDLTGGEPLPERGQLVSQMITVRNIELADAQKAVDALKHKYAMVYPFPNINSLLVTDDSANINRILQIMKLIDQPIEVREEPNIIHILHAKPSEIKAKLEEIIAESQKDAEKRSVVARPRSSGQPGVVTPPATPVALPPGIIRAPRPLVPAPAPTTAETLFEEIIEDAERGIIRGRVKIVADDRTGILIIITRPENMGFFEKIIRVLDVATAPDVMVKVFRLEYADAKTVASMLNDLIGAASAASKIEPAVAARQGQPEGEAAALREYVQRLDQARTLQREKSKIGELAKDNIKILSDERTNALIIMASRADLATLSDIIADMDMMLSQVLIEAVILDVQLTDTLSSGIDWLQRSMVAFNESPSGVRTPVSAFTGSGGGGGTAPFNAALNNSPVPFSGLSYYFTFFGLNLDTVIKMAKSDNRAKVVSTPVILTTDNKEAKITSTDLMYVYSGTTRRDSASGGDYDNYEQKEVGLDLTVKPHINQNKVVMMDVKQRLSQPNAKATEGVSKDNLTGTIIYSSRTLEASIAVENHQTIVLGGLVSDRLTTSKGGIPLLSSIPFLGRLFGSDSRTKAKTETVVFITPYVLDTPEDIIEESRRRKEALQAEGLWQRGWSDSDLAEPARPRRPSATPPINAQPQSYNPAHAERDLAAREKVLEARKEVLAAREKELSIAMRERELATRELAVRQRELDLASREAAVSGAGESAEVSSKRGAVADQEMRVEQSARRVKALQAAVAAAQTGSAPATNSVPAIDPETAGYIRAQEKLLDRSIRKSDDWADQRIK